MAFINDYEKTYDKLSIINQCNDYGKYLLLLSIAKQYNPKKILDLGCAEGTFSILLSLEGFTVTASDISEEYLIKARKNAKKIDAKINIIKGDIENDISQFKNETYDFIFLGDTIEHFRNTSSALLNIRNILTDNGILFITTPNATSIARLIQLFLFRSKIKNYFSHDVLYDLHLNLYDLDSLNKILAFTGFKIIKILIKKRINKKNIYNPFNNIIMFLEKKFIYFSSELLLLCKKTQPLNYLSQINSWSKPNKK